MTPKQIIEIARRYGSFYDPDDEFTFGKEDLIAFAQAIIDAERERSEEPVAWLTDDGHIFMSRELASIGVKNGPYPLYRRPPPKRKLTDEEITEIMLDNGFTIKEGCDGLKPYVFQAVRAIERRINGEEE